jgi:hypothetical protein
MPVCKHCKEEYEPEEKIDDHYCSDKCWFETNCLDPVNIELELVE